MTTIVDRHTVKASAAGVALDVISGQITLDDTWMPYVQGELRVKTPGNFDTIDPRLARRCIIELEQRFGEIAFTYDLTRELISDIAVSFTSDLTGELILNRGYTTTADLTAWMLDNAYQPTEYREATYAYFSLIITETREFTDGITSLTIESDETLLNELKFVDYSPRSITGGFLRTVIGNTFDYLIDAGWDFPSVILPGDVNPTVPVGLDKENPTLQRVRANPGDDLYTSWLPILHESNTMMRSFGVYGIEIVDADYTVPGNITVRQGVNLVDFDIELARRENWADALVVSYNPEKSSEPFYIASVSDITTGWNKPFHLYVDAPSPLNGFGFPGGEPGGWSVIANKILSRLQRRAYRIPVTAVSNYNARPRMEFTLLAPGRPETSGRIQAVRFDIGTTWEMTVTAQELEFD